MGSSDPRSVGGDGSDGSPLSPSTLRKCLDAISVARCFSSPGRDGKTHETHLDKMEEQGPFMVDVLLIHLFKVVTFH